MRTAGERRVLLYCSTSQYRTADREKSIDCLLYTSIVSDWVFAPESRLLCPDSALWTLREHIKDI